jgi:hypothetical protein
MNWKRYLQKYEVNKLLKRSDLKNDAEDSKIWRCDVTIKIIVI